MNKEDKKNEQKNKIVASLIIAFILLAIGGLISYVVCKEYLMKDDKKCANEVVNEENKDNQDNNDNKENQEENKEIDLEDHFRYELKNNSNSYFETLTASDNTKTIAEILSDVGIDLKNNNQDVYVSIDLDQIGSYKASLLVKYNWCEDKAGDIIICQNKLRFGLSNGLTGYDYPIISDFGNYYPRVGTSDFKSILSLSDYKITTFGKNIVIYQSKQETSGIHWPYSLYFINERGQLITFENVITGYLDLNNENARTAGCPITIGSNKITFCQESLTKKDSVNETGKEITGDNGNGWLDEIEISLDGTARVTKTFSGYIKQATS